MVHGDVGRKNEELELVGGSATVTTVALFNERGGETDNLPEKVLGGVGVGGVYGEKGSRERSGRMGFVSDRSDDAPGTSTSAPEGPEQILVLV